VKLKYAKQVPDEITGAKPLTSESCSAVLHSIASQSKNKMVFFDLDSTLLDNRRRNAKIMQEFGELHNEALLIQAKAEHWQDWSARNAMIAMGLPESDVKRLIDTYTAFWQKKFFTSHYCQFDVEIAGAAEYVTHLQHSGGIIRYLTGRHEAMREGTQNSLSKLGFPVPGSVDVELIMKPLQSASDDDFKKSVMVQLDKNSVVLAAFDNEPYHINAYRYMYPEAVCVHLHTDHSMRPIRLLEGIVSICNFVRDN